MFLVVPTCLRPPKSCIAFDFVYGGLLVVTWLSQALYNLLGIHLYQQIVDLYGGIFDIYMLME